MPRLQTAQCDLSPSFLDTASTFPLDVRLLVTTRQSVLSWSRDGVDTISHSETPGGIVTKGLRGRSGIVIAKGQGLALHSQHGTVEPGTPLMGIEGRVQLLEYAEHSKNLYFTTSCQTTVQCYSLGELRLLKPVHGLPSQTTILTISPNSQLLLSGSESPRTIYLQNLQLGCQPTPLHPGVSDSPVASASFHPERSQVFLLAFKDGSFAAYDASRIGLSTARKGERSTALNKGHDGEIGRFPQLHAVGRQGGTRSGHVDAKFLPGHRSRAVTVGSDGKCRIVEFEHGGKIIKTWHAKGPATSVSVLSIKANKKTLAAASSWRPGTRTAGNRAAQSKVVIAVGRLDGKVLLFDTAGTLVGHKVVDSDGGMVVSVEWVSGTVPISTNKSTQNIANAADTVPTAEQATPGEPAIRHLPDSEASLHSVLGESPFIIVPATDDRGSESTGEESGTIKHTGIENVSVSLVPISANSYMDLFSPVKTGPRRRSKSPQKRSTRARPRPRISSTTFLDEGETSRTATGRVALSPAAGNAQIEGTPAHSSTIKASQLSGTPLSAVHKVSRKRALGYRPASRFVSSGSSQSVASNPGSKTSSILAGLRLAGAGENGGRSLFATYIERHASQSSDSGKGTSAPLEFLSTQELNAAAGATRGDAPPSESDPVPDDLWLTDIDSDSEHPHYARRRFDRGQNYRLTSAVQSLRASSGESVHTNTINAHDEPCRSGTNELQREDTIDPAIDAQSCTCGTKCCGQLRDTISGLLEKIRALEDNVKRLEQGHD